MTKEILKLKNVSKLYPGVVAVDHVNFSLREGEVLALAGENGAGKSTLIKMISGAISPTEGSIEIFGKEYRTLTPALSKNLGISVIYQEFNIVRELSVWENVFLGREIRTPKTGMIKKREMQLQTEKIFQKLGVSIDVNTAAGSLSVGYQQLIEVAKALVDDIRVLILDEPTAPLTDEEVTILFDLIDKLSASGVSIIYISHRLEEIFKICDRITVMRDGVVIDSRPVDEFDKESLIKSMVGREIKNIYPVRESSRPGEEVLRLEHVYGNGIKDASFSVHKGEIVGLCGLIGAGRTELAQVIFGVFPAEKGDIYINGEKYNPCSPLDAIRHGIALVPEDRKNQGLLLEMSIEENITLPILPIISKATLVNRRSEKEICLKYKDLMRIKASSLKQKVKNLSGGNQQKAVLAKWLSTEPDLIILDEPTRGIDVGAKFEIYTLINEMVTSGKAVILISSEMPELIGMADRIIVLGEKRITGEVQKGEFDQELLMHYASMS